MKLNQDVLINIRTQGGIPPWEYFLYFKQPSTVFNPRAHVRRDINILTKYMNSFKEPLHEEVYTLECQSMEFLNFSKWLANLKEVPQRFQAWAFRCMFLAYIFLLITFFYIAVKVPYLMLFPVAMLIRGLFK